MRELKIAYGDNRKSKHWKNNTVKWEDLVKRLGTTQRTTETVSEYAKMAKASQDTVKDVGGFVGGHLQGGRRQQNKVLCRSFLALDMDFGKPDVETTLRALPFLCCYYSTHKHTAAHPRLRLIIPLSRDVTADEYGAIGRMAAKEIGIDMFDDSTYEPHRLMYWPSTSIDGEYIFHEVKGEVFDPDVCLAKYDDWKDVTTWPVSSRRSEATKKVAKEQADPLTKDGIVGVFCRTHSITDVLETELKDLYAPSANVPERYDFIKGESTAGVVIYEDKFFYSHHATDPASGKLLNAFDLVRIHKFGNLEDKASFKAMEEYALKDVEVKRCLLKEHQERAIQEFADWQDGLERGRGDRILNTLHNLKLILRNDEKLNNIRYNLLADNMEITGEVPWQPSTKFWRDADDAQLLCYLDDTYGAFSQSKYQTAMAKVVDDRRYHPILEYFEKLPPWDGVPRVETLLIKYLGSEDNPYTREVTKKILCAAVARVKQPGVKFDHILVLNGPQGIGKSTLIGKLGGEWYSDSLSLTDMNDKTAAEKLQGYWLMEIGELAGMRKADVDRVKAFISRQDDKYRASFGRRVTPHPRQCVFIGTTNTETGYLRDITGNRRFWSVRTPGGKDYHPWDLTDDDVKQIWAEALELYKKGEALYLNSELERISTHEQQAAMELDDREGIVSAYLDVLLPKEWPNMGLYQRREFLEDGENPTLPEGVDVRNEVCNMEIWCECFGKRKEDITPGDSYRIAAIMARIEGWEKSSQRKNYKIYGRQRVYLRT